MKIRIKKGMFSWKLTDETGVALVKIKNKNIIGAAKNIYDQNGKLCFSTDIVNLSPKDKTWNCANSRKYIIYKNMQAIASANLYYAKNPDRTLTQKLLMRPPQVDRIDIETIYGLWVAKRQKNNGVTITQNGALLGNVTPFFTLKPIYLECDEKYDIAFWAAVYVLTDYMMHEDDMILV